MSEWVNVVPPRERVRTVAETMQKGHTMEWIANQAEVDKETAQGVLAEMVDEGILNHEDEMYEVDVESAREKEIRDLRENHDQDELVQIRELMQDEVSDLEDERERKLMQYEMGLVEDAIDS